MPKRRDKDYVDPDRSESELSNDAYEDSDGGRGGGKSKQSGKRGEKDGSGKSGSKGKDKGKGKASEQPYAWEASFTRTWDTVQEDEAGGLAFSVQDWIARNRRKRLLAPSSAVRRTIIRHLILLLDLSSCMMDRDLRPNRFDLSLQYAREFITEWFDQNPLGQIGIVGMRGGVGERIGEMSGNPQDVLKCISDRTKLEPAGEPSLQNALEMARATMSHLPSHSSKELVIIYGALTTCDPDNVHDTVDACVKDKIRVSVVALAAEMKLCRDLCNRTGGVFGVALNEGHFKDLLFELVPPPTQRAAGSGSKSSGSTAELMRMGFPTRLPETSLPTLCACHSTLKSEGYLCPRCQAKLCDVPTDCDVCGLMVVSSPHLARSYHHLFPVKAYKAVMVLHGSIVPDCHGCAVEFPRKAVPGESVAKRPSANGRSTGINGGIDNMVSELGRYRCPDCKQDFCSDCDEFVHEVLHVCPGCK